MGRDRIDQVGRKGKGNRLTDARKDVLDWDSTFIGLALTISLRSKDPSTQVGAVIVDGDHHILTMGYNGTPRSMNDDDFPWGKTDPDALNNKYPYVIHAERNAVLNVPGRISDLKGATAYVTLFPCNECMKSLAQAGITRIVYLKKPVGPDESMKASIKLAEMCGISLEQYEPKAITVELEL